MLGRKDCLVWYARLCIACDSAPPGPAAHVCSLAGCTDLGLSACATQVTYDLSLARYYMWAQTSAHVYIAIRVPTGAENLASLYC